MMSARPMKTQGTRGSFWYPNVRERFRAFLPELLLSVIATTCMSVAMSYHNGSSVALLVIVICLTQIFVQGALYVCTYLIRDERSVNAAWLVLPAGMLASEAMLSLTGLDNLHASDLTYACPVSVALGTVLFYLMRLRWTFVMLVVEMLMLVDAADEVVVADASMLFVHFGCIAATMALFVIRSSATRITRLGERMWTETESPGAENRPSRSLGIHGQIAALGAAIGIFCVLLAFAGTPAAWQQLATGGGSSESVGTESAFQANPPGEVTQDESVIEAHTTDEVTDSEPSDGPATSEPRNAATGGLPVAWLLLALLVLPIPLRLVVRRLVRFSIERTPRAADRAAKLYLGIIRRLAIAGIARDKAETPIEFLSAHEEALVELTASTGIGLDEWMVLTDAYEKARYAETDPTEAELKVCWRLYDALPACARKTLGWRRYLTGAFWRM